jgi:type IV secretory pathway VirB10-like protein
MNESFEQQEQQEQPQEQAATPSGTMPRNIRSWVILGIAVVMLLVIWLTGWNRKSTSPTGNSVPLPAKDVSVASDQAKADEVADVQKQVSDAQHALQANEQAQEKPTPPDDPFAIHTPVQSPDTQHHSELGPYEYDQAPVEPDPIVDDMRKRTYMANFESNVALSFRDESAPTPASVPTTTTNATSATPPPGPDEWLALETLINKLSPEELLNLQLGKVPKPPQKPQPLQPEHPVSKQKQYTLFEGTTLNAALVNRLIGLAGPITCMVTSDVHSLDGQHLLIPAGTKVLGEAKPVDSNASSNLVLVFHRMVLPNGMSVSLAQSPTLQDSSLESGDRELRILAGTIGIGAMAGFAQITPKSINADTAPYFFDYSWKVFQTSINAITRLFSFAPKVTVKEGHPVTVYLTRDLQLPDYSDRTTIPGL